MKPTSFLQSKIKDTTVNVTSDYRYMKTGYYVSLHAEILGNQVIPSSEDMIDSSRTPILLLRAAKTGIPTMPFLVTGSVKKIMSELTLPVIVFAVNPFIHDGYKISRNRTALYQTVKSLGMNYKFAVCAQPLKGEIVSFKSFFGKCDQGEQVSAIAEQVYNLFKIPICKLHVQKVGNQAFLCGLEPLEKTELTPSDLKTISREASLLLKQGETLSG